MNVVFIIALFYGPQCINIYIDLIQAELVKVEEGVYVCPDFPSALNLLNTKLRGRLR